MDAVSSLYFQCPFNSRPWYESNSKLINYIISFYVNVIVLPFRADFELFEAPFTNAKICSRYSRNNQKNISGTQSNKN